MSFLSDNFELLESQSEKFKVIGHPIRLAIIDLLGDKKELSVTEIYTALDIEQAVASHHLRILKNGKILSAIRSGKNTFYKLAHQNIRKVVKLMLSID